MIYIQYLFDKYTIRQYSTNIVVYYRYITVIFYSLATFSDYFDENVYVAKSKFERVISELLTHTSFIIL